jgi:hypothetical protein
METDVWGAGPFDNAAAREAARALTQPERIRSELREGIWKLQQQPSDLCCLGYAAAEIVAAAMADAPYWQCEVAEHPLAADGSPASTFYLPVEVDQWIRTVRPRVPIDVVLAAMELVEQLIEHADLWQDDDLRNWYLQTTLRHLEAAAELASVPACDDGDDDLI